jgi:hypothetical protein
MNEMMLKQQGLAELLKKIQNGEISPESIPMEAAPLDEMTPEKAKELDKLTAREPASEDDIPMVPEKMDEFAPKGSFVGGKLGQQVSPDVVNPDEEKVDQFAKLRQLIRNR